jgi:cytochrome b pre-mRNA-processing protein 3
MLRWLRKRSETARRAEKLYGDVVTAARQSAFYGVLGVPDTPEGRFELIALHLYLALEGLGATEPSSDDLKQRMIEVFVEDMDDCMREMGVGDLTVPKKVKRAAAAFYERATIYHRGLMESDESNLAATLGRTLLGGAGGSEGAPRALASYVSVASTALRVESFDDWVRSGAAHRLLETSISSIRIPAT